MKIDINKANLIKENQHIIVGLSGGPDSVCLFYSLLDIAEEMNLTLYAVHVNHQLIGIFFRRRNQHGLFRRPFFPKRKFHKGITLIMTLTQ